MIRPAEGADLDIIANTWKESNWDADRGVRRGDYKNGMQLIIERLLVQNGALILCDEKDPTVVVGWICATPPDTLHYVYVKSSCRRLGMCTDLLKEAGVYEADPLYLSHMTMKTQRWKNRRDIRYDPYRVMR